MLEMFQSFQGFRIEILIILFIIFILSFFKFRSFSDIFKVVIISFLIFGFVFYFLNIIFFFVRILFEDYLYIYLDDQIEKINIFLNIISFLPSLVIISNSPFYLDDKELTFWESFKLKHKIRNTSRSEEELKNELIEKRKKFYNKGKLIQ